ncbi:DNA-binding HxlR family transcriptional regulator [Saccharothrix tamanrassetensis]|uniref:DNA-binding HxlR family transcriptional regulator n=1 Tax=Saccharothrix tamanrassetensis TaxID=1051531 RepID=A0A841CE34_9PSEU|nr:helix-turn-helix domain-containing protein [Saccharothrix tamanrassetensis]MBB5954016.1 DNA-binding HxlR family transcriptional regulator [Saccharothrix tamanrassetensis]
MLRRTYDGQICSVARTLEVVGERWTLLIVRDALLGVTRFDGFLGRLSIARNVLSDRLSGLVEHGVLERVQYQDRPPRHEYRLTNRGRELTTVILSLREWGDRHLAGEAGPPQLSEHADCGGRITTRVVCERCAEQVPPGRVVTRPAQG